MGREVVLYLYFYFNYINRQLIDLHSTCMHRSTRTTAENETNLIIYLADYQKNLGN